MLKEGKEVVEEYFSGSCVRLLKNSASKDWTSLATGTEYIRSMKIHNKVMKLLNLSEEGRKYRLLIGKEFVRCQVFLKRIFLKVINYQSEVQMYSCTSTFHNMIGPGIWPLV